MSGPIPAVPQVMRFILPQGEKFAACATDIRLHTRQAPHSDGVSRTCVIILVSTTQHAAGMFTAATPETCRRLAAELNAIADQCDAMNATNGAASEGTIQ